MDAPKFNIRRDTVDVFAKGVFAEASRYGLKKEELIRFVNTLLDLTLHGQTPETPASVTPLVNDVSQSSLPLTCDDLTIRAYQSNTDLTRLQAWLTDPDGQRFLRYRLTAETIALEQLADQQKHTLGIIAVRCDASSSTDKTSGPETSMAVDRAIGCMAFLNHDRIHQKAELRKLIGDPTMRSKGYAKRASRLWIEYGIQTLGLKKIYLNTLSTNIRNIRLNEELGFSVEGVLRNEVFFDGKHHDVIRMGLCVD